MTRTLDLLRLSKKLAAIQLSSSENKDAEARRTIFYSLKGMGGVYFKCLQVLSVTHKFLEGWAGPAEMTVFKDNPIEPIDISSQIDISQFDSIDHTPIAAGSFAQVYRATLTDGTVVAIKILRPTIAKNLKKDLKYLKRLGALFSRFLPTTILDYRQIITEFSNTCLTETDYSREIANMEYFSRYYTGHPHVVIPRVYKDLSSPTTIVQEFIEGPTFADCLSSATSARPATQVAKDLTGSDLWTQLTIAGGEALRMAMTADFLFGDPHPGNIKLLKNNQIAFIDFGIIARKPTSQRAFYDWVKSYDNILTGKGNIGNLVITTLSCFCSDLSLALDSATDRPFTLTLAAALSSKFDSIKTSSSLAENLSNNGHFFRLFTDALDSKNALNVILDIRNFGLIKAMQSYLGSLTVLDNGETGDRFATIMHNAMVYAITAAEQSGIKNDLPSRSKFSRGDSLAILSDTLTSLANGDEYLFNYIYANI